MRAKVSDAVMACGQDALSRARHNCPVRTGNLKDSLDVIMNSNFAFTLYSGAKYAQWVEKGRGWVFPKNKKCLHWVDFASGKKVFAKFARPAKANPFMQRAVSAAIQAWKTKLEILRWKVTDSRAGGF